MEQHLPQSGDRFTLWLVTSFTQPHATACQRSLRVLVE